MDKLLFFCFLVLGASTLSAQRAQSEPLDEFVILVQRNIDNSVTLECEKGCAFKTLSFSLKRGEEQVVDQYGMRSNDAQQREPGPDVTQFSFSVAYHRNGLKFRGILGTAWTELSFSLPRQSVQPINQMGMISKR